MFNNYEKLDKLPHFPVWMVYHLTLAPAQGKHWGSMTLLISGGVCSWSPSLLFLCDIFSHKMGSVLPHLESRLALCLLATKGFNHEAVWHLDPETSILPYVGNQWHMKKSRPSCWKGGPGRCEAGGDRKDPDRCWNTITAIQQTARASLRIRSAEVVSHWGHVT
jgi:hypothetical protein